MNAADQRRLTPWLIAICVVLAALWVALLAGIGRGVRWDAPGTPKPLPTTHHAAIDAPPPLAHYAVVWQRPLFTTTRQPALETAGDGSKVSLDNLELTGIIMAPGLHMALLRDRSDGHGVRVREGAHVAHGNWVLQTLKPRSAVFVDHGRHTRLTLKAAAHDAAAQASTASTAARPPAASSSSRHQQAAAKAAQHARMKAIKQRIEQRRRQQAAHAGDH